MVLDGYFSFYRNKVISPNLGYTFWQRYLGVFKTLTIFTRKPRSTFTKGKPVNGKDISFIFCPFFHGIQEFIISIKQIYFSFLFLKDSHSFILRVPGLVPFTIGFLCILTKKHFAMEVVADPFDVFSKNSFQHFLRPIIRYLFTFSLQLLCQRASAISYVTEHSLQRRYPPNSKAYTATYSSIELKEDFFSKKVFLPTSQRYPTLINCAMMQKKIKGQDIFLEIIYNLKLQGFYAKGILIGDGDYFSFFKQMASDFGIMNQVSFVGLLSNGKEVIHYLDKATFYISASRQEGLPRAVIEAMARGLPCLGSNVGGTSELLESSCICDLNARDFSEKIISLWNNKKKLIQSSKRNKTVALNFLEKNLKSTRESFYTHIKHSL